MSFDLYVFDRDVPDDEATIGEWMEDDSRWSTALTPRLATFVAELERRYPSLDDDPDNSPWASWPLTQAMVDGTCCAFNIVWSQSERMSAEMRALCSEHGLTLYDPQDSLVVRPGGSPSASTKRIDEAPVVEARLNSADLPIRTTRVSRTPDANGPMCSPPQRTSTGVRFVA